MYSLLGINTDDRLVQLLKQQSSITAILDDSTALVKLLQSENALPPTVVTLSGIVTFDIFLQFENALFPILVTLFGIVTLVK